MSTRHLPATAVLTAATVLAAVGTAALLPATAGAANPPTVATVAGGTLTIVAGPGFANRMTVLQRSPSTVSVRDALRPITTVFPCTNSAPNEISCPDNFAQRLQISLGDGNDVVHNATTRSTVLRGDAGDDVLSGGLGADVFVGGGGRDLVTYQARTAAVTVRLDGVALDGQVNEQDDVRTDVEDVRGGRGNDQLVGSAAANRLFGDRGRDGLAGLGGNDLLDGGADADALAGGSGVDTATYAERTARVFVDLDGVADDGQAGEGDNARTDLENVIGGTAADRLTGNASANRLEGRSGSDRLSGLNGADVLDGGADADIGDGGAQVDVCTTEVAVNCP